MTKRIVLTAGEPSGIGPEIMLSLAKVDSPYELIVSGSIELLKQYAELLKLNIEFKLYDKNKEAKPHKKGSILVLDTPLSDKVIPGVLNKNNAHYVIETLRKAAEGCMNGEFSALVTGPDRKSVV